MSFSTKLALITVTLGAAMYVTSPNMADAQTNSNQKYEYKVISDEYNVNGIDGCKSDDHQCILNVEAKDGWRFVAISPAGGNINRLYLERPYHPTAHMDKPKPTTPNIFK